jgi:hypothetical protein
MMPRELIARERRRRRIRDAEAILALALWSAGGGLLYLAWTASATLAEPLNDVIGTAVYLVTFFYLFAIWPILSGLDRLFRRFAPSVARTPEPQAQDGGRPISPATSSLVASRDLAGSASSSGDG